MPEHSSATDRLTILAKELDARARQFHESVKWYRNRFYLSTLSTVLLSAVITVIAGWKPALSDWSSNAILVLGALSTLVSAWGAFFSPRESWLLYARTLAKLRALQLRIQFAFTEKSPTDPNDPSVQEFFETYQAIHDEHNKSWLELRSSSRQPSDASSRK